MVQMFNTTLPALAALVAVVALVLLAGRAARLTGLARAGLPRRGVSRSKRLTLQDTLPLDRVRRLHIVQCDGRDLVLLTGGTTDIVVGWLSPQGEVV